MSESRPLVFGNSFSRKYVGRIWDVTCPWCGHREPEVRQSTLNNRGKRCECGALWKGYHAKREGP